MCIIVVMKKILKKILSIGIILITISSVIFFIKGNSKKQDSKLNPDVLGLPDSRNNLGIDIFYKDSLFKVNWYEITNIDNLSLSINFDKLTSQEFKEQEKCIFLSSGGYYKSDYLPTGFLIDEYKEISPFIKSDLADGIFSVNDFATPRITSEVPRDRLRIALQAGPLLKENGEFIDLTLRNDEEARRVILGVTGENIAYFVIFYNPNSTLIGPYLEDLPGIVKQFENETGIIFADVINLDGGAPTVFRTEDIDIVESTIVGNFFCLK